MLRRPKRLWACRIQFLVKRANELTLPRHNSTTQIAQRNYDIVNGRLSKNMKPLNPAKPWGLRDHFTGSGYYTNNAEGYVPKPESLTIPSRPPPPERTAETQPFVFVPKDPDDPHIRIDITAGSVPMTASQLMDEEALAGKNAATASNALSMAEYIYNYPGMPEGAQIVLHQLKLDLVAVNNFSWRLAHIKMLLPRFITIGNLKKTQPPIDEDQKLTLPHAPFTGTTLFRGELAILHEANTKLANAVTVYPTTAPPASYPRPYVD